MGGYSSSSLVEKLDYKPGEQIALINPPEWFPEELALAGALPTDSDDGDWAHGFFINRTEIEKFVASLPARSIKTGFWVSWPKKSSGVETDVTEQTFRDLILPTGWVDTKVAAIDETWSGLKFLRRKKIQS